MEAIIQFVKTNYLQVLPIILVGAFGFAVILERIRALYFVYPLMGSKSFFEKTRELLLSNKIQDALSLSEKYRKKPVAAVMKAALLRIHQPDDLIEQGLQIEANQSIQSIQKRTAYLSTIANVATLMGLLGTIVGLVQSFEAIGSASAQERSTMLAVGISLAMNSTILGLCVAIPCLMVYSFLAAKTNKLVSDVDQAANYAMDLIKQRYYSIDLSTTQRNTTVAPPAKAPPIKKAG